MPRFFRRSTLAFVVFLSIVGMASVGVVRLLLPAEDGVHFIAGLNAPVEIDFDALGIPCIRANSRNDVFEALGYATARDRLFQMDLLRQDSRAIG